MSSLGSGNTTESWRESARYWDKHAEMIREMFAPITEALLEAARPAPGERFLDVAGGTGEPSLSIAGRVGAGGLVVFTDVAPGMIAAARRRASGLPQIRFAECSGDGLPFADSSFDAVVCRLGVMFFPDPERGVREMARVARPGGRIALAVWSHKDGNPCFGIPSDIINLYAETEPDPPDAPGAWRFAEAGRLASMLDAAGCEDVREQRIPFDIRARIGFDEFWRMRVEMSDTLRSKVELVGPECARRVAEEVRVALADYFEDGAMRIPAEALVVSGVSKR